MLGIFVETIGYTITDEKLEIRIGGACPHCRIRGMFIVIEYFDSDKKSKVNYIS